MDLLKSNTNKLYFTYTISALGSALVSTIYSTVDMIAIGQYAGPVGSAMAACVNPFWPIMFAPGVLLGIGGSVMMNNRRGSGNEQSAREYFTLCAILSVLFSIVSFSSMFFFARPLLAFFGAEGEVLDAALEYLLPLSFSAPTFTICACISTFIRNDGEAMLPTVATIAGGVFNIFGDVFFVFDFGLGLGLFGAGLATSLGQIVSFIIICGYFFSKKCRLKFTKITNIPIKLMRVTTIGLSAFVIEVSFAVVNIIFINVITSTLTTAHLAVYGTASTVLIMLYCFYGTFGTALQPIASSNFGAKQYDRVRASLRTAMICTLCLGAVLAVLTQLFPEQILKMYMDVTDEVLEVGPGIMRAYTSAIAISGVSIVASYYLQSVLKRAMSVSVSLLRGVILPVLLAATLPFVFGESAMIWWCVPIAEVITVGVSAVFIFISNKQMTEKQK